MGEREATCILSRLPPYGTHTGVDAQQSGDGALNFAAAFGKSTLDRQVGFVIHAGLATSTDSETDDAGQHVVGEVAHKLVNRAESNAACRTTGSNNKTRGRCRRAFVERRKRVPLKLVLSCLQDLFAVHRVRN